MEAAAAVALVVAAPLTISGCARLKDCLGGGGAIARQAGVAALPKAAFVPPFRNHGGGGHVLEGHVAMCADGQRVGSYLVFNGETLRVGSAPDDLRAVAALGGATVASHARTVAISTWEAPRALTLEFNTELQAAEWASALREAAKLPHHAARLEMLAEHICTQENHSRALQSRMERMLKDSGSPCLDCSPSSGGEDREQHRRAGDAKAVIGELEEKLRELTREHESLRRDHELLLREREAAARASGAEGIFGADCSHLKYKAEAVFCVDCDHAEYKADHFGLAYRRSMRLEDKEEEIAEWGTTVAGEDMRNGWVSVGERFLPVAIGGTQVLTRCAPPAESFQGRLARIKDTLLKAVARKEGLTDEQHGSVHSATVKGQKHLLQALMVPECEEEELVSFQAGDSDKPANLSDQHAVELEQLRAELEWTKQALMLRVAEAEDGARSSRAVIDQMTAEIDSTRGAAEAAEVNKLQLVQQVADAEARAAQLQMLADTREQRLERLESLLAGTEEAMLQKAQGAEAETARLQGVIEDKDRLVAQLLAGMADKETMANAEQELIQRAAHAEALVEQLQAMSEDKDRQLVQLHEAIAGKELELSQKTAEGRSLAEQVQVMSEENSRQLGQVQEALANKQEELTQRQTETEALVEELQAMAKDKDQQLLQLQEAIADQEQELSRRMAIAKALEQQLQVMAEDREWQLGQLQRAVAEKQRDLSQRATDAEALAEQLKVTTEEARQELARQLAHVQEAAASREQELSGRAADAELSVEQLRMIADDKDRQLARLQESLDEGSRQLAQLQEPAAGAERESRQALDAEAFAEQLRLVVEDRDRELLRLQEAMAYAEEELVRRAVDAEARMEQFQELASRRGEELAQQQVAGGKAREALHQRAVDAELFAEQLRAATDDKDRQLAALQQAIADKEQELLQFRDWRAEELQQRDALAALSQRAMGAETRAEELRVIAEESDRQLRHLQAEAAESEQELAQLRAAAAADRADISEAAQQAHLQRALDAEANASELQALAEEKDVHITQLQAQMSGAEEELAQLRALQACRAESDKAGREALLKEARAAEEITKRGSGIAEIQEVGIREAESEALLRRAAVAEQEVEELRLVQAGKDARVEQLLEKVKFANAAVQAQAAEALHLQKLVQERDACIADLEERDARIRELEALTDHLDTALQERNGRLAEYEGLTSLIRASLRERNTRLAELEELTPLLQASLQERDTRLGELEAAAPQLQALLQERDGRIAELEAATPHLQALLQERDARIAELEANAVTSNHDAEKEALQRELNEMQRRETQLSQLFEGEKLALRRHMAEQFETERSAIQEQAMQLERELQAASQELQERDALIQKLHQAERPLGTGCTEPRANVEGELPGALAQRLAATEMAAEEAEAKLRVAEQELALAQRTIDVQMGEHEELQVQRAQATEALATERSAQQDAARGASLKAAQLEAQVAQLEREKLAMREELTQRTLIFNRELHDVGVKMRILEEAVILAGGTVDASSTDKCAKFSGDGCQDTLVKHAQTDSPSAASRAVEEQEGCLSGGSAQPTATGTAAVAATVFQRCEKESHQTATGPGAPQTGKAGSVSVPSAAQLHSLAQGARKIASKCQVTAPKHAGAAAVVQDSPVGSALVPAVRSLVTLPLAAAPPQGAWSSVSSAAKPPNVRQQEPYSATPMFPLAPHRVQVGSPMVSPLRLHLRDTASLSPAVPVPTAPTLPLSMQTMPLRTASVSTTTARGHVRSVWAPAVSASVHPSPTWGRRARLVPLASDHGSFCPPKGQYSKSSALLQKGSL